MHIKHWKSSTTSISRHCYRTIHRANHRDLSKPTTHSYPVTIFLSFLKGKGESRIFHLAVTLFSGLLTLGATFVGVICGIRSEANQLETATARMASSIAYEQLRWASGVLSSTHDTICEDSISRSSVSYFYMMIYPYQEIPIEPGISFLEDSVTLAIMNYNSRVNQLDRARSRVLAEESALPDSCSTVPLPNSYRLYYLSLVLYEEGAARLVSTLEQRYPSTDSSRASLAAACLDDFQMRWNEMEDILMGQ